MSSSLSSSSKLHLVRHLAQHAYEGKIQLPRSRANILNNFDICEGTYQCRRMDQDNEVQSKVKEFVLDNFYATAPVPVALELFKERKVTTYLEDEINQWFHTGVSFGIFHGDKIIGTSFNFLVEKPTETPDYVSAREWHNYAAELVTTQSHHNPLHAWRHYQLLHWQHFAKQITDAEDALFGLHMGTGCVEKEYRGKNNIIFDITRHFFTKVQDQGGVISDVVTFPAGEIFLRDTYANNAKLVDSVMYKDLNLTINGKRIFKPLQKLNRMCYFSLVP